MRPIALAACVLLAFAAGTLILGCDSGGKGKTLLPPPAAPASTLNPSSGDAIGGTLVTITAVAAGANFQVQLPQVTFGGAAATGIVAQASNVVTCQSPAGTGRVDVEVSGGGLSNPVMFPQGFAYHSLVVAPTSGSPAGGETVTVTLQNFPDDLTQVAPSVTFGAQAGTGVTVQAKDRFTVVTPAGQGTVDVVVTGSQPGRTATGRNGYSYGQVQSVTPNTGAQAGGDSVTIVTQAFPDDFTVNLPTVSFGGVQASNVLALSPTSISCDTPAHAVGQVDVAVESTVTPGIRLVATNGFTYRGILSVTPPFGPIPGGGLIVAIQTIGYTNLAAPTVTFERSGTLTETLLNPTVNGSIVSATVPQAAVVAPETTVTGGFRDVRVAAAGESERLANGWFYSHPHVLLTEICVLPNEGEFIEIYNATAAPVALENYYLTDGTNAGAVPERVYWKLVDAAQQANALDSNGTDFLVQFPAGSTLQPGAYATIAIDGVDFQTTYGVDATYAIRDIAGTTLAMRHPLAIPVSLGNISLSNGQETVVLFSWDGASDRVQDVDYAFWGAIATAASVQVDKTGASVDGPDGDTTPSAFAADTQKTNQVSMTTNSAGGSAHASGSSLQRVDYTEQSGQPGGETATGGNGITGHDETSENLQFDWNERLVTPGSAP